jgi:hypothetical protein
MVEGLATESKSARINICDLKCIRSPILLIFRLKLQGLTTQLEVALGPDTGDLNMRVGKCML